MTYQDNYKIWLNGNALSEKEKQTLLSMDEKEKEESFYQELSFGTGGIRGILGLGPNRINKYTIQRVTLGFANYLKSEHKLNGVAISYDNRYGSYEFAYEAAKVLAFNGIKSYIYKALRPTPMLSYLVRHFKTSAGIMLTASHNPKEYNGFKAYNDTGAQLSTDESNKVIEEISKIASPFHIGTLDNDLIHWIGDEIDDIYLNEVEKIAVRHDEKDLKIVYSPLHGTGGTVIPKLLDKTGYTVYREPNQMKVDPEFSHTKSSNPEDHIAYEKTIELARKKDADVIFVTDPDADRLGVAYKLNDDYHILNGNQTASMMLYYILSEKKQPSGIVYTTVVSSHLLKDIAHKYNQKVGETLTGFKFIGEQAEKNQGKLPYIFGCEESYGSLVSDFVRDKDAVQAVYLLAEILNTLKSRNLTVKDYLDEIYHIFGYYLEDTINLTLKGIEGSKRIIQITDYVRLHGIKIDGFEVKKKIDFSKGMIHPHDIVLPPSNVLKFESDQGFIIFRPSGTEPKLKIYISVKTTSHAASKQKISDLKTAIMAFINQI
ncbi:phospho-sugar mutase [Acholeplasma laidlawii]|uniref:Phosphoglucomutase / phosphomannomutase n=2 Tax=Acholeplasma laidlawii TaxID=2148 RepID=A9NGI3_ACHLI|nr:phospho-sugar mutase [Acholeplasma laidlawii]ABX81463.1 phosphoglucomutase / phosphomannomutase [Acholeplasma laidlawii PG-8A]NWH09963.1 phospho-sugar mutase [Acholeplasma laidlawii]NWH11353.1 phospho-sugar mutase [Acholeplasma laidlawii]NWH13237.1 phospho-sugar mutase [Acholeplasma laidlawii]NWH15130.1 phospho-sugar mutase [Acholeplasma laidlawii]